MDICNAIYKRKSVRKYSQEKLPKDLLDEITAVCSSAEHLYKNIDMKIHLVDEGEKIQRIMSGIIGNYGKIIAPHYLVATSEQKENSFENVGYALEQVVLKLTAMGIATCWLGGHIKDEALKGILELPKGHVSVVMVSFGYPQDKGDWLRKDPSQAKRKSISDFVNGGADKAWMEIMEAVRLAPSAANTQPWSFKFEKDRIHVYCTKPANFITKKLLGNINRVDMGIALSHMKIAAQQTGMKIEFEKAADIKSINKNYNYITSVVEIK